MDRKQKKTLSEISFNIISTSQMMFMCKLNVRYCNQLEFLDLSGACGLSEDGAKSIYRYKVGGKYHVLGKL